MFIVAARGSSKTSGLLAAIIADQMAAKGYSTIEQWILSTPNPGETALCLEQLGLYHLDNVSEGDHICEKD